MQFCPCHISRCVRGKIHTLSQANDDGREAFVLGEMNSLKSMRLQRALRGVREDQYI